MEIIQWICIIGGVGELFLFIKMVIQATLLKVRDHYAYLDITPIGDKICFGIWLIILGGNLVMYLEGNSINLVCVTMAGAICYNSLNRILCLEDNAQILIQGRRFDKASTYIEYKALQSSSYMMIVRDEKHVISIWTSVKGKERLCHRLRVEE